MGSDLPKYSYKAFISYSHNDRKWSEWLHKKLEGYRLPKSLLKERLNEEGDEGRLHPIFRDREELPAHENMTDKILEAISVSEYLIVVCSPHSARSFMVNEEIREFRKLNGNKNILCLIASGRPSAFNYHSIEDYRDKNDLPLEACFPPALFETDIDLTGLPTSSSNPLAADVRAGGDGKKNAYLKIAAGILNVQLGELVRRDFIKRQRQIISAFLLSLSVIAVLIWATWTAVNEAERAAKQKEETEAFAGYFADILFEQLPKTGREDLILGVAERLQSYYDALDAKTDDDLYRKAVAYNRIAHMLNEYDTNEDFALLQLQAIEISSDLVVKYPENMDYLYLKAQAYSSMAQTITWRGQQEKALEYSSIEKEILHKLLEIDPDNQKWLRNLGISYTVSGLAYMHHIGDIDAAKRDYEKALELRIHSTKIEDLDKWAFNYLGAAYGNMMRVHTVAGPVSEIAKYVQLSQNVYDANYRNNPGNNNERFVRARSIRDYAHTERFAGHSAAALRLYEESYNELQELLIVRPENLLWRQTMNLVVVAYAEALITAGRYDRANVLIEQNINSIIEVYNADNPRNFHISTYYLARYIQALIALDNGAIEVATDKLSSILDNLEKDATANILSTIRVGDAYTSAYLLYGQIIKKNGSISKAQESWKKAIDIFGKNISSKRMDVRANLAQIYLELGETNIASEIIIDLNVQGYREAGYTRIMEAAFNEGLLKKPDGWQSAPLPVENEGKAAS